MEKIRQFVVRHLWWVVLLAAAGLLVVHSLSVQGIVVDNTSLILLLIVLASPFIAAIKRIKIGEFEAEIQPSEVKQVAKQVQAALPAPAPDEAPPRSAYDTGAAILELVETDPVVALAKLRIEFETRLRRLFDRVAGTSAGGRARVISLGRLVRELVAREVFDRDFGSSLLDVIGICNRAIHGEDIRDVDARQIAESGTELLDVLERTVRTFAVLHPIRTSIISNAERDSFETARFRLTTIVPLVDKPERREYELSQQELDEFFDSYSEFAEFVIKVERIDGNQPTA
jgi:hypothetical protein